MFISPLLRGEVFFFRDHFDYFLPLRHFTASALQSGELPLWNPLSGSGERWLANPQTAVFYPPFWIFLVLPFAAAYVIYLWIHILILGVGGFHLFSRWTEPAAAMIASIALMLCGPTLSLLDISNNLGTFAWFPLTIHLAVERRAGNRFPLSGDAAVILMLFLGGEPFLAAAGALVYGAIVASAGVRRLSALVIIAALSFALGAVQILPFFEIVQGSDRLIGTSGTLKESMRVSDWIATLFPRFGDLSQRYIPSVYLGIPIVAAAILGVVAGLRGFYRRSVIAWMMSFFAVVILAAGSSLPGVSTIWRVLRLDVSRYPSRLVPLGAFAVIALASVGFGFLFQQLRKRRLGAAGLSAVVAALAVLFLIDYPVAAQRLLRSTRLEVALEPYRSVAKPPLKLARLLEPDVTLGSAEARMAWLSGYLNLWIGCFDAWTPAPVVAAKYLELHDRALFGPQLTVVDFLSIGYIATQRELRHPAYRELDRAGGVRIYQNRFAAPVAQQWARFVWTEPERATEAFSSGRDSSQAVLYLSCRPGERCTAPKEIAGREEAVEAEARFAGRNRVIITTRSPSPSVVSLSQLDAPGWEVTIDGQRAAALRAQGLFRAVRVPAGSHQVIWNYRPRVLITGSAFSTIALVVMMGELLHFYRRRGRQQV